ncbi:MAG: response regulator, partial [Opitutales bacterium]
PGPLVLVVDDDEGLRVLMAETLRAEGYEVSTAGSGAEARTRLEEQAPDLMLLDLKMGDVEGPALLKQLKRDAAPVPFVVVTGQGDEKVAVEMMKHGARDYVMKNTALLDLLPGVVRRALATVESDRALAVAQAELRASAERFSAAMLATNDGVWEMHIPDDRIYFSARWKQILGFGADEIADDFSEWQRRIHPEDRLRFAHAYRKLIGNHEKVFHLEHRLRHKDGSYRWVLSRALLICDAEGRPLRMTGALTDITERKQLEKEILRISDREQWRIGQDLHDGLGQQLTAIELMCQSFRADLVFVRPDLATQASQICELLREAIGQTRALARGLTPFMLDSSGLPAALAQLAEQTQALGRGRCTFVCPEPVTLDDREAALHLYRIAQEAVGNALKHAKAGEVSIGLTSGADGIVRLEIADNGRGIRASKKPAAGIGLRVMRHRANAIGAELTVTSRPDEGTRVTCMLTRKHEAPE